MWLTNLAAVMRRTGLDVVEVKDWQTRGHGGFVAVDGIVDHHTAGPVEGDYPSLTTVTRGRVGLAGPLANLGIGRTGRVFVIAAGVAWHAGQVKATTYANARRIGIEVEATGRDGVPTDWPAVQLDALARVNAACAIEWHFDEGDCLGHKEVCWPAGRKIDPHPVSMPSVRAATARYIALWTNVSRDTPRDPVSLPDGPLPVLSAGNRGTAVALLQNGLARLGWGDRDDLVTAEFDHATRRAVLGVQVAAGLLVDGIVGPRTWAAINRGQRPRFTVKGVVQRGDLGSDVGDVQRGLVRAGISVKVDNDFGPKTEVAVRHRQAQLHLAVDGRVGPDTAAGLGGRSL